MQIDRLWTLLDLHRQELHKSSARHALSSNGKKELSIDQNISLVEGSDKIRNINMVHAMTMFVGISHLMI